MCKKLFTPRYDRPIVKQIVCSNKCCLIYYDTRVGKKSKAVAKRVSGMVGKRSMGEVRFEFENIDNNKLIDHANYEGEKFLYRVDEFHTYTPDWCIVTKSGKHIHIEYKGVLDLATRKKMILFRDQHPDIDIRFVFQRGTNPIRKGSKTTYLMWAAKNGFMASDGSLPVEWLK
jgi:hypothetical protein